MSVRLNKFLASQLSLGRRQADEFISAKKVLVNGQVAELGRQLNDGDSVSIDKQQFIVGQATHQLLYVLFDKPIGYVCSRRAQGDSPTIYELLPAKYHHLKPAGRLDKDTSGLLLLTNDGDFAHRLTHPSFQKTKVYTVELDAPLQPLHHQMINDFGVSLADGTSQLSLEKLDESAKIWQITMHEGRNRQIRRTFEALGYNVVRLRRLRFGSYSIDDLRDQQLALIGQ